MVNFKSFILLALVFMPVAGCVSAEQVPVAESHCLPMKDYTLQEQNEAAGELASLPSGSILSRFFVDYGQMRAAYRACLGK